MNINHLHIIVVILMNTAFYAQSVSLNFQEESNKVIEYFVKRGNKQKVKAANFLIENMPIHKSILAKWQDKEGNPIAFDETSFADFESAKAKVAELKKPGNSRVLEVKWDTENISSEFLINDINSAFKYWEESLWKQSYSFETFCEYMLPYRNATEPVEFGWRAETNLSYKTIVQRAENPSDPTSVCSALIDELELIEFKLSRENPQPLLSLKEMNFRKEGSCPDLANNSLLIARSLGIAATYDYTPFHAASSNAHFWNTVIDKDGVHIPFNGNQNKPYEYDTSMRRIGKALRMTYSNQQESLVNNVSRELIAAESLSLPNVIDVTDEYVNTYTINYSYDYRAMGDLAYICVYNKGEWRPTWWSKVDTTNIAKFTKMGSNLIYLPASVKTKLSNNSRVNYDLKLEKHPVLLDIHGKTILLKPDFNNSFNAKLSRGNEKIFGEREFNTLEMENGAYLDLQYWNDGWQSLGKHKVKDQSISVKNIPENALFRLLPNSPDGFERVFTILKDGFQLLWY